MTKRNKSGQKLKLKLYKCLVIIHCNPVSFSGLIVVLHCAKESLLMANGCFI